MAQDLQLLKCLSGFCVLSIHYNNQKGDQTDILSKSLVCTSCLRDLRVLAGRLLYILFVVQVRSRQENNVIPVMTESLQADEKLDPQGAHLHRDRRACLNQHRTANNSKTFLVIAGHSSANQQILNRTLITNLKATFCLEKLFNICYTK